MTNFVKDLLKYSLILFLLTSITVLLLVPVYKMTKPVISKIEFEKNKNAINELFPDGKFFEMIKLTKDTVNIIRDKNNTIIGFVYNVKANGYGGPIFIVAGITPSGYIKGIRILSHTETPGLGARIVEVKKETYIWEIFSNSNTESVKNKLPWFQKQFDGLKIQSLLLVKKKTDENQEAVEAVTGATISSRAVVKTIKGVGERILKEINKKLLENVHVPNEGVIKNWQNKGVNITEASEYL
ncbi:MAG: RnfABCDGE type electron transport complex subunit G [Candidatus Firestonebacteria bacterium]|nr:RnfABCDGE type electron transport complex subunit G [Candidatus Firestonebacteria bacterium]